MNMMSKSHKPCIVCFNPINKIGCTKMRDFWGGLISASVESNPLVTINAGCRYCSHVRGIVCSRWALAVMCVYMTSHRCIFLSTACACRAPPTQGCVWPYLQMTVDCAQPLVALAARTHPYSSFQVRLQTLSTRTMVDPALLRQNNGTTMISSFSKVITSLL